MISDRIDPNLSDIFDRAIEVEQEVHSDLYERIVNEPDMVVYKCKSKDGKPFVVKSYVTFDHIPSEALCKLVFDDTWRKEYAQGLEKFEIIDKYNEYNDVYYMQINPPIAIVSRRDFVLRRYYISNYKGVEHMMVMSSCDHHLKPAQSSPVRGLMLQNVRIVRKNTNGRGSTLYSLAQLDMGGNIPMFLIESKAADMAKQMKSTLIDFYQLCVDQKVPVV